MRDAFDCRYGGLRHSSLKYWILSAFFLPAIAREEQEASSEGLVAFLKKQTVPQLGFYPRLWYPFCSSKAMNRKCFTHCLDLRLFSVTVKTFNADSSRFIGSCYAVSVVGVRKELD